MPSYAEYFLNSPSSVPQLDLIELSHPNFSQSYRIVRNAPLGVTVDLSTSETDAAFIYYPVKVAQLGARADLDAGVRIDLGDLGELIPEEIDAVSLAGGFATKPSLRYWTFRGDDFSAPIYGPIVLEVPSITLTAQGSSFDASAPALNSTKTGERETLTRFPMLTGMI